MIELPHLWLPDRLRERREDERLLRGRGGLSRRWMPGYPCCCRECVYCSEDKPPSQMQVVISNISATLYCAACGDLNGTYVLNWVGEDNFDEKIYACSWQYMFPSNICEGGGGNPSNGYAGLRLELVYIGSYYYFRLFWMDVVGGTGGASPWDNYTDYWTTKPTCSDIENLELPNQGLTDFPCFNPMQGNGYVSAL